MKHVNSILFLLAANFTAIIATQGIRNWPKRRQIASTFTFHGYSYKYHNKLLLYFELSFPSLYCALHLAYFPEVLMENIHKHPGGSELLYVKQSARFVTHIVYFNIT